MSTPEVTRARHTHADDSWYCCPACDNPDHGAGSCGEFWTKEGKSHEPLECVCGANEVNAYITKLETEIRHLKGYGDDPSKGPIYVSIFQHREAMSSQRAQFIRWATTGRFNP